jgi:hypothetical protein
MRVVKTLFDNIDWPALRPDVDHRFLTGGQDSIKGRDYALAAVSTDGSLAVCYIPTKRTVEVDLRQLSAGATSSAAWFDPTNGTVQPAASSGQAGDSVKFVTPAHNAGGDEDWVLVFGLAARPTT